MRKNKKRDVKVVYKRKHNAVVLFRGNTTEQGEWLKYRAIGASSIHNLVENDRYSKGIINKPEYSSAWILYQELKGFYKPTFSDFMQDKMDFGHFAEDFIRGKFIEKAMQQGMTGFKNVTAGNEVLRHKDFEFATCTPDGWIEMENGYFIPLECKTGDSFQWNEWSGDTVPDKYYSQCQWILSITDKPYMFILGWINNRFTKVFTVERDDNFINQMFKLASSFWKDFKAGIEPKMVGNKIEADALGLVYEIPKETKIEVESEIDIEAVESFNKAIAELKEIEDNRKPLIDSFKIKIKKEMFEKGVQVMTVGNLTAKLDKRGYLKIA